MAKKTISIEQKKAELENALKRLEVAEKIIRTLETEFGFNYGEAVTNEDGTFVYKDDGYLEYDFSQSEDPDNWRHDEYVVYKEMLEDIKDLLLQ